MNNLLLGASGISMLCCPNQGWRWWIEGLKEKKKKSFINVNNRLDGHALKTIWGGVGLSSDEGYTS